MENAGICTIASCGRQCGPRYRHIPLRQLLSIHLRQRDEIYYPYFHNMQGSWGSICSPPPPPSILKFTRGPSSGACWLELAPDLMEPERPFQALAFGRPRVCPLRVSWWLKLSDGKCRSCWLCFSIRLGLKEEDGATILRRAEMREQSREASLGPSGFHLSHGFLDTTVTVH